MAHPRIYLAGPIQHEEDRGRTWRERVEQTATDIDCINPLAEYEHGNGTADSGVGMDWTDEEVVQHDRGLIERCDGVVVRYRKTATWGTPAEQEYARSLGLPVFVLTQEGDPSPWATAGAECVALTVEEVLAAVRVHFDQPGGD